jgi:uncharacterized protein YbjT (DUF2867 family)
MKIVLIGGTGKIGSRMAPQLTALSHEVVVASRSTGVDTVTGEGLAAALAGADVVVDVTNPPSLELDVPMEFFRTSTGNVLAAEAGIRHHVVLSVVGADQLTGSAYLSAKVAQEELVRNSGVPYTIVRATQFFEFVETIGLAALVGDEVRLPPVLFQPIATSDVAEAMVTTALAEPRDGVVEIGGPETFRLDELVAEVVPHKVVADPNATYFGGVATERTLVPGPDAVLYGTTFAEWRQRT